MPPKVRELIANLERAGFVDRGGKGSHRNFVHAKVTKPVVLSGNLGDDAKQYQVRAVQLAGSPECLIRCPAERMLATRAEVAAAG